MSGAHNDAPVTIFGASGFVGGVLAESLAADHGFNVQGFSSRDADLRDAAQVRALSRRLPPHSVWVVASAISPDRGVPPLDVLMANVAMARNLAEVLAENRAAQVCFLSSIDVYGREGVALPISESSPIRPSGYYAISKYTSELIMAEACREAGIPLAVLRLPGVYGPGDTHHGPVASFLRATFAREGITVHGNGQQRRDLLYVRDLPRIVSCIVHERAEGLFNAVTGLSVSLNEMLEIIAGLAERKLPVTYNVAARQVDLCFEESLLVRRFPSVRLTPLEKGLRETYACLLNSVRTES